MADKSMYHGRLTCAEQAQLWETVTPREAMRPIFSHGAEGLCVEGDGRAHMFGYWKKDVEARGGGHYRLRVRFRISDIEDVNLHVMNLVHWKRDGRAGSGTPQDIVSDFRMEGDCMVGEGVFYAAPGVDGAEIQLGLRYLPRGSAHWLEAEWTQTTAPAPRPATISVVKWAPASSGTREALAAKIGALVEQAAALRSDLLLLPEFTSVYCEDIPLEVLAENVPSGETCRQLSRSARENGVYVCAGVVERDGDVLYNTAVIFGRDGGFVGKYRKTHLYWPEGFFPYYGETPGDDFPVFDLDFGRVGVVICYDGWYGETVRLLALKGAKVVLFPNAGYEQKCAPARAIDNNIYLAVSSIYGESQILNMAGETLALTRDGIAAATLDVNQWRLPHPNAGGSANCSSGGRRSVRNAMSNRLYEEIAREMKTWLKE